MHRAVPDPCSHSMCSDRCCCRCCVHVTAAFDPSCGLFVVNDQGDVYPNPDSLLLEADDEEVLAEHRDQVLSTYSFIGSMIGKGQPTLTRTLQH